MTYIVVLDNVVQALFGPPITVDGPRPAGLLWPEDAYQFSFRWHAQERANDLPAGAVVLEVGRAAA